MKRPAFFLCLPVICLLLSFHDAMAQDYVYATGNPSFGVNIPIENGFINVANGNLHMEFPLATQKQRGALNLNERIVYDSRVWMILHNGSYSWSPTNVPNTPSVQDGWRFVTGAEAGSLSNRIVLNNSGVCSGGRQSYHNEGAVYSWTDPSGTLRSFDAIWFWSPFVCPLDGGSEPQSVSGWATDGSGYQIVLSGDSMHTPRSISIRDKTGTQVYPQAIDRYGNYWSFDANGNLIDDVGRTPVIVTTNGNVTYYDVLAPNGPINNNGLRVRYTVTTTPIQVSTNFNETSVSEWSGTFSPVQSIQLPDGSSYTFSYDSYGEMTSVKLPTGGVINYGWTNYFDSYQNVNRWLASRTVGGNPPMTFTPSVLTQCSSNGTGCQEQVNVHAPSGDEKVYQLTLNNGAWNTKITAYNGIATPANAVLSTLSTYDFSNSCNASICNGAEYIKKSTQTTTLMDASLSSQIQYGYNNPYSGQMTYQKQWDYYTGSPSTTPTHETDYVYSGYDLTQTTGFYNGTQVAQTTYGYTPSPATTTSGIAQHGTTSAGGPYLQTVSQWINTGGSSTTTYAMDDTGMVTGIHDPKGNFSSTSYQCANALPYQSTNALSQTTTYGYDCNSGAVTSVKDPNDLAAGRSGTTYTYEAVAGRPGTIGRPDGGTTAYSYPSSTEVDTTITATPDPPISSQDISDAFGRTYQHIQAGVSTETTYDANGRTSCITNPHFTGTSSSTDGSTCMTVYDGLDRPKTQTQPDGSTLTWNYTGNITTSSDEAGNAWARTSNVFGQLTNVTEPGSLQTAYSYDGLGNLIAVNQAGGAGDTARRRSFTYDSLSRLICSAGPENTAITTACPANATTSLPAGVISYSYDANGNVLTKTDARGVTTTYTYDALNRILNSSSNGSIIGTFGYDAATTGTDGAFASANPIGRLVEGTNGRNTSEQYSYDPMGRIVFQANTLPSDCCGAASQTGDAFHVGYDLAGNITSFTYPDGHHITQSWDSAGRLASSQLVDINGTSASQSYLQSASYLPDGSPHELTLGNGVQQIIGKNPRLQIQSMVASTPLAPFDSQPFLSHTYCYMNCATGGVKDNGNIWGITDTLNASQTQGFTYDNLNRITSFSLGGVVSQQYKIDSFGNMSPMAGANPLYAFNASTNRINLPCAASSTPYDNAGNQTCDTDSNGALRTYSFDAENRISQIAMLGSTTPFETYTYDGDGNRVRKDNANGTYTEYVYFNGQPLAERDQSGAWTDYIYAGDKKIARIEPFDVRAHLSGVHVDSNPNVWAVYVLNADLGYQVKARDKLSFRSYQHNAHSNFSIGFTDGSNSDWYCGVDNHGNCLNDEPTSDAWVNRVVDLGAMASGKTISYIFMENVQGAPMGSFDVMVADMSISSTDGTITPIVGRQFTAQLQPYTYPCGQVGVSDWPVSCATEIVTDPNDFAGSPSTVRYMLSDHLNSAQMEFTAGGWPVWKGQFAPFGQELDTQSTANNYKFTGLERDSESGLDHTQFRQYGSTMGRWMSPDPYNGSMDPANPQSFNRYSYVNNMPLSMVDPLGLATGCVSSTINGVPVGPSSCTDWGGGGGGFASSIPVIGDIIALGEDIAEIVGLFHKRPFKGKVGPNDGRPANSGFLHSSVCAIASPLLTAASATNSTLGVGFGASAGVGFILGVSGSGNGQIVADTHGNVGLAVTSGGNPGYGVFGVGGLLGAQGSVSSADTIYDLSGWSTGVGGSFGPFGLDVSTSGSATTLTGTLGAGVGGRGSALSVNYTAVPKITSTNCGHY